jgi:hypothetical protein
VAYPSPFAPRLFSEARIGTFELNKINFSCHLAKNFRNFDGQNILAGRLEVFQDEPPRKFGELGVDVDVVVDRVVGVVRGPRDHDGRSRRRWIRVKVEPVTNATYKLTIFYSF